MITATTQHGVTSLSSVDYFRTAVYPGAMSQFPLQPLTTVNNQFITAGLPSEALTTTTTTTTTTTEAPYVIPFNNRVPDPVVADCGLAEDTTPLVVHGKPTRSGQYPWLTAIFHLEEDGAYKFRCAGSLVTQKHVVTGKKKLKQNLVITYVQNFSCSLCAVLQNSGRKKRKFSVGTW